MELISHGHTGARRSRVALHAAMLASVALIAFSCNPLARSPGLPEAQKGPDIAVALDDSFRLMFPETAMRLSRIPDAMGAAPLPGRTGQAVRDFSPLPVSSLPVAVSERRAQWAKQAGNTPGVLIASPAVAAEFLRRQPGSPDTQKGSIVPRLVIVAGAAGDGEAVSEPLQGVDIITMDFRKAYASLGRKAAKALPEAEEFGKASRCTIIFHENFLRRRDALAAFSEAFESVAGSGRLEQRMLGPAELAVDRSGSLESAAKSILESEGGPALLVLAVDDAYAVRKIAADMARVRKEDRKKAPVLFADASGWDRDSRFDRAFSLLVTIDGSRLADAALHAARKALRAEGSGNPADAPGSLVRVALKIAKPGFRIF
jgi:hypothetical protein